MSPFIEFTLECEYHPAKKNQLSQIFYDCLVIRYQMISLENCADHIIFYVWLIDWLIDWLIVWLAVPIEPIETMWIIKLKRFY